MQLDVAVEIIAQESVASPKCQDAGLVKRMTNSALYRRLSLTQDCKRVNRGPKDNILALVCSLTSDVYTNRTENLGSFTYLA